MHTLILMRHAKTEPWQEGVDDASRALIGRGREEAATVARELAARGLVPDLVLVSSARRTRETWTLMAPVMGDPVVRYEEGLYLADADEIAESAFAAQHAGCVMIVGHNPGLHYFAADLARMGEASDPALVDSVTDHLPTGAAAVFDVAEDATRMGAGFTLKALVWGREIAGQQAEPQD